MAKISFKQNPTFKVNVMIPRLGAAAISVPFVFNYFDRDQLADYNDAEIEYNKQIKEMIESDDSPSVKDFSAKAEEFQIEQITKVVAGWNFTEELNDDNIRAMVRSAAAVPLAILEAFKASYAKAREGN